MPLLLHGPCNDSKTESRKRTSMFLLSQVAALVHSGTQSPLPVPTGALEGSEKRVTSSMLGSQPFCIESAMTQTPSSLRVKLILLEPLRVSIVSNWNTLHFEFGSLNWVLNCIAPFHYDLSSQSKDCLYSVHWRALACNGKEQGAKCGQTWKKILIFLVLKSWRSISVLNLKAWRTAQPAGEEQHAIQWRFVEYSLYWASV